MKALVEHEFDGCFDGCPYCSEAAMGPNDCMKAHKQIVGYSRSSSQIPEGKKHPDWCPVAFVQEQPNPFKIEAE